MVEEQKEEVVEEKEEVQKATNPTIDAANEAAKRTEEAAEKLRVQLDRQEAIEAQRILGGGTEAGKAPVKKEETPAEYTKRVMAGEAGK